MKFFRAVVAMGLCTAALMGITSEAAAASTLTAQLQITTTWQGNPGYCAIVVVTNNGPTAAEYSRSTFNVGASSIYTSWWNSTLQGSTGTVTITNNSPIVVQPGASNSNNGFCAMGSVPSNLAVQLDGATTIACGSQSCNLTSNYCCASSGAYSCQASACSSSQINVTCTATSGCSAGQYCWFKGDSTGQSTYCTTDQGRIGRCNATGCRYQYCTTNADCGGTYACTNGTCGYNL